MLIIVKKSYLSLCKGKQLRHLYNNEMVITIVALKTNYKRCIMKGKYKTSSVTKRLVRGEGSRQ